MDPTGKYILTTRCRTGRSVRGFRLPPCCSFEERRDIERVIVKGLMKLEGDLAGDYFPLAGMLHHAACMCLIIAYFVKLFIKGRGHMLRNQLG